MARDMTAGGYAVTKSFEGRALKSYKDCVGVWTIGYGNTNYDKFATDYLKRQIGPGITITNDEAEYLLHESMKRKYLPQCEKAMGPEASDGAFDASGSFHYNTGAIGRASWVPKFRRGEDYEGSLLSWNKGGGKVLAGLTRRRKREYAMAKHNDYGPEGRNAPPTLSAGGHVNGTVATPSPAATPAEPTAPTATPDEHVVHAGMLQKGDNAPEVADLQNKLVELGFKVPVTGRFDDATDKAVRSFQHAHPQLDSDGVVGPATRTQFQRELDAKRKLKTSTASTTTPTVASAITDQATNAGMPGWVYAVAGVIIVSVAAYYAWQYRDELRGWVARKMGGKHAGLEQ